MDGMLDTQELDAEFKKVAERLAAEEEAKDLAAMDDWIAHEGYTSGQRFDAYGPGVSQKGRGDYSWYHYWCDRDPIDDLAVTVHGPVHRINSDRGREQALRWWRPK
jgi:hypothetical protein